MIETGVGEKRTFTTGATRSTSIDKGRFDLLPWTAIQQLAIHCAKGAEVHGERNCEIRVYQCTHYLIVQLDTLVTI